MSFSLHFLFYSVCLVSRLTLVEATLSGYILCWDLGKRSGRISERSLSMESMCLVSSNFLGKLRFILALL
jgi:hypothetical protein